MKKINLSIVLAIFILNFSVSGAKYDDAVPIMKKMIKSLETFISNIEKGENAKAIASALDNYTKDVLEFAPEFKEMMKKYPELKNEKSHPEALKSYTKKFEDLLKKLMKFYGNISKYMNDPVVKDANKRWLKAMSSLKDKKKKEEKQNK